MGDDQSEETRSVASSRRAGISSCDSRTLIIWIEDWDDIDYVPVEQLAQEGKKTEKMIPKMALKFGVSYHFTIPGSSRFASIRFFFQLLKK